MRAEFPPGPDTDFLRHLWRSVDTRLPMLLEASQRYGDLVHLPLGRGRHGYLVNHPDLVHEVFVENPDPYYKVSTFETNKQRVLPEADLEAEHVAHLKRRKSMQPAFDHTRVNNYAELMVQHTEVMLRGWRSGEVRDIGHEMSNLALNIVANTLIGGALDVSPLVRQGIITGAEYLNRKIGAPLGLARWVWQTGPRHLKQTNNLLKSTLIKVIQEHRASGKDSGDLLSILLLTPDDSTHVPLTDEQAYGLLMVIFFAGHETTANALTWTWYLLAQHPQVEQRLLAELRSVLAGRVPTLTDLPQLVFTGQVIREAMRLYPPAWLINRRTAQAVQLGGYDVPSGSTLFLSPYTMQREVRFYNEPERFMPERFEADQGDKIPRYAYFPFGGGAYICMGQQFSLLEARLVLATVAQRFHMSPVNDQQIIPEPLITLRPKTAIRLQLVAR